MTKLLEEAIAAARHLPPSRQDDLARVMLSLAADQVRFSDAYADDDLAWARPFVDEARVSIASGAGSTLDEFRAEIAQTIAKLR